MDNIAHASEQVRKELFGETAARKGMSPAVVEKDFWVCWILGKIFADESLSRRLLFKGGTSLSKAFGLIRRFSEDVDLILDWRQITDEDPSAERSNSSQTKLNKAIEGHPAHTLQTCCCLNLVPGLATLSVLKSNMASLMS